MHGGTPFQLDVKDPQTELFDPTIKGTENFLEAIQKTPGIERVVFIASTAEGIHGKNYLLTSESYRVSDISLMLNHQEPEGKPSMVYSNNLASTELGIRFKPARVPLNQF